MSGLQIVRTSTVGYDQHGQDVLSEEAFVKVLVSFLTDGSLRQLKGAPLSAFLCVALHEAKIVVSGAEPLTVSAIEGHTGWSRRSLIAALDHLVEHAYVTELPERGAKREKQYRVKAYAFFGKPSGSHLPKEQGASAAPLHKPCGESPHRSSVVAVPDQPGPESMALKQQQTQARAILASVRARGRRLEEPALSRLSATVGPELAQTWADWVPNAPQSFRDPIAFMVKRLSQDPTAEPPGARQQKLWYEGFEELVKR